MPRRLSIPKRTASRGGRWRRSVYPWHDSDDIPEPRDGEALEEFPWEWLGGNRRPRRRVL